MAIRPATADVIRQSMKGYCYLCVNVEEAAITPDGIVEVINGVSASEGRFVGGLAGAPGLPVEDEIIDYIENIYAVNGPIKGGWDVTSTTYSATATLLELSEENLKLIFPDIEEVGDWDDGEPTPVEVYGKKFQRSGAMRDEHYLSNVVFAFEGEAKDEIGMIVKLTDVANRADSKEFQPDDDGNITGVEVQLQAHEDLANFTDPETGRVAPCTFYLPDYAVTPEPA